MTNPFGLGSVQIGGRWYVATAHFYDESGKEIKVPSEILTYENLHNGMKAFEILKQHLQNSVIPAGKFYIDGNGMHIGGQSQPLKGRVKELWEIFDKSFCNPLLQKVAVLAPKAIGEK